jgi:hypothetical protein
MSPVSNISGMTSVPTRQVPSRRLLLMSGSPALRSLVRAIGARLSPAAVLGAAFGIVIFAQVVLRPILGYSDNGDFDRVTHPLGLVLPDYEQRNGFVNPKLAFGPSEDRAYWNILLPLQRVLVDGARWLGAESFDIRWLGTFYAVAGGLCLWLLLRALPGRTLPITVGLLLILVLGDSAFVAYLGSYYSEPGSLLGFLLVLAGIFSVRGRRQLPVWQLTLLAATAAVLVLAKVQNVALVLVLVPALMLLRPRKASVVLGIALVVGGGAFLHEGTPEMKGYYVYDTVFASILPHSPTPEADLRELGLDPALVRYTHSSAYHNGDFQDPSFQRLLVTGGRKKIYAFYLRHPLRAFGLGVRATRDAAELRPSYLGNRVAGEGYPRTTMACELCLYSSTSRALKPAAPVLLPALYLLAFLAVPRLRRRARQTQDRHEGAGTDLATEPRTLADGIAVTALLGVLSFATAVAGEGDFELVKHLYLFEVLTGVLVSLLVGAGILEIREHGRRRTLLADDEPYPYPAPHREPATVAT